MGIMKTSKYGVNSYYLSGRARILEYARETDSRWKLKGHFVSAYDEGLAMEKLADIIMGVLTEEEQKKAYADFAEEALYYDAALLADGSKVLCYTVPDSEVESYLIRSRYRRNGIWEIRANRADLALTGSMEKDAERLMEDERIFHEIKKTHPPVMLLSDRGYMEYGNRTRKRNNFEKCAYFAEENDIGDVCTGSVCMGFITMHEAQEMELHDPLMTVHSELRKYYYMTSGKVFMETEYLLREKTCRTLRHDLLPGNIMEDGARFLGFYSSIGECLKKNQEELGIRLAPDCILERIRIVDSEESMELEDLIRRSSEKAERYRNTAENCFGEDTPEYKECMAISKEAETIADYLTELRERRMPGQYRRTE